MLLAGTAEWCAGFVNSDTSAAEHRRKIVGGTDGPISLASLVAEQENVHDFYRERRNAYNTSRHRYIGCRTAERCTAFDYHDDEFTHVKCPGKSRWIL